MITQTEVHIFPADHRQRIQDKNHRSYLWKYALSSVPSDVFVMGDETLNAKCIANYSTDDFEAALVMPLVGGCMVMQGTTELFVNSGELLWLPIREKSIRVVNPHYEIINYLMIRLPQLFEGPNRTSIFPLNLEKDKLLSLPLDKVSIHIGRFSGRAEGVIHSNNQSRHHFATVIEGTFELQNRLLLYRDSLAIPTTENISFEALSNEAILLVVSLQDNPLRQP